MIKLPDLASLALLSPRIARSATVAVACARIVDDLARTMQFTCAIAEKHEQSWEVVCAAPRRLKSGDDLAGATEISLGSAGGVERVLRIARADGGQLSDAAWLEILQQTLSDALTVVALRAEVDQARRNNLRCYRFAAELLRPRNRACLYRFIVETMARAVGAGTASLAVYNASENALSVVATYGYPTVLVEHVRVSPGEGVLGRVFATGRAEHARTAPPTTPAIRQRRYRGDSYMAAPLKAGAAVLAVISVTEPKRARAFSRADLATLRVYGIPAALALSGESLRDQAADLAHLATVDALTGISNRRHFDKRLTEEIQRSRREHGELALLMIDIDDFKALNDARGHQSGDAVLRDVADILRRSIRSFDVCARYGGEEFAILMPGASASTAYQIAERIRRHTESHFIDNWRYASGVRPTLSVGVANASEDTSGGTLVAMADAALLWAKGEGKNVVKLYVDMPTKSGSG
jgi:diguanylate cyclase (GGDEF)-like protein